jgi:CRISPR-associated endonuclease/helicase Cas3
MMQFWAKTTEDGKPGISVYEHMVNVGCVACCIAESSPALLDRFKSQASDVGALAALHDLGKISPGFQQKCQPWLEENQLVDIAKRNFWQRDYEQDHGRTSHSAVQDFLQQQGISRSIAIYLAAILGAHHGRLKFSPNPRGIKPPHGIKLTTDNQSGINWEAERLKCAQRVWDYFTPSGSLDAFAGDSAAIWWLAGLATIADWIGSDENYFSPAPRTVEEDVPSIACHALDSIGFTLPVITKGLTFQQLFGFPPNEMQERTVAAITGPGVYVIEAPMGMGKTEAALWAAYQLMAQGKANGIYFALPTQVTSNRIHLRMNDFLERIAPESGKSRLIHGSSWLMQEGVQYRPAASGSREKSSEDARGGRDWFTSAKRALIAPFGVGTVDQALLGVVAAKHFFVRRFALAGKVVILDEVHSYDIYTGTLIDKLIETLERLGCTVIILSATLTGKRRRQIVSASGNDMDESKQPYPLITGRAEGAPLAPVAAVAPVPRSIAVEFTKPEIAAGEAITLARAGGTVLWICNTIGAAQKQFLYFKEHIGDEFPLGLLHSRFTHNHREEHETDWMGRFGKEGATRCGSILVATQVVEQSVDLDADLLITELAPTDMLLQRIGRLWRHDRGKRLVEKPRICIIEEVATLDELRQLPPAQIKKKLGPKAFVYDPYILLRSLEVWQGLAEVNIPLQVRQLIEETYKEKDDEPVAWQELFIETEGKAKAYSSRALMSSNIWQAALDDREGVQTRLNEMETVSLVLCHSVDRDRVEFIDGTKAELVSETYQFNTAKAIHRNLVKVPRHHFQQIEPCKGFEEYLFESHCAGVVGDGGSVSVNGLRDGVRLNYTVEMGLLVEKKSGEEGV